MHKTWKGWLKEIFSAFSKPTIKQKEVFSRFFQALSVASFIGAITVTFAGPYFTWLVFFQSVSLLAFGIIWLIAALVIGKGE